MFVRFIKEVYLYKSHVNKAVLFVLKTLSDEI